MPTFNDSRVRKANDRPLNRAGAYVLYWMQGARRLRANHALDYALHWCKQLKVPLVIFDGIKLDYPWATARVHRFLLDGLRDTAAEAARLGLNYWPWVETPDGPPSPLPAAARDACLVVTDDYPQFVAPAHTRGLARATGTAVHAVDGNGVVPLALLGAPVSAAAHLRPRIHKLFADAWGHRAAAEPDFPVTVRRHVNPPFRPWTPPADLGGFVRSLPVDQTVPPVPGAEGGPAAGRRVLEGFTRDKLARYAEDRNCPGDPDDGPASGLSWHLHYGHVGIQEVAETVLGLDWTTAEINQKTRNKDDFFCRDSNVNSFLDEAVTWRDVGYHWHYCRNAALGPDGGTSARPGPDGRPSFNFASMDFAPLPPEGTLAGVLPAWARATLDRHAGDRREHTYTLDEFEHADTHDDLWNATQRQLVAAGRIHNYLRMLWGKKVLEWSPSPEAGYRVLEHLNNKYALDGRDPNSYTGVLWCFGLFDRPWPPDRAVFGTVRYMSSENTGKKFDLSAYRAYVASLPPVGEVRAGKTARRPVGLF